MIRQIPKNKLKVRFKSKSKRTSTLLAKNNREQYYAEDSEDLETPSDSETKPSAEQPTDKDDPFAYIDEATEDDNRGTLCELHSYDSRENSKGEEVLLRTGTRYELDDESEKSPEAALVFTRFFVEGKLDSTRLDIKSPHIKKALKDVVPSYPGISIDSDRDVYVYDKPKGLFHYRRELEEYAQSSSDDTMKKHVAFCLQYMKKALRREIAVYETTMGPNKATAGIDFDHLWMAFRPGTMVYSESHDGLEDVQKLVSMWKFYNTERGEYQWKLQLDRLQYDGKTFGYTRTTSTISKYTGYKPLVDLNMFPLEYHKEFESVRERLVKRGKKYVSLRGFQYRVFNRTFRSTDSTLPIDASREVQYRIMIDASEYYTNFRNSPLTFQNGCKIKEDANGQLVLSDEDFLISYYRVPGFSLVTKKWDHFELDGIEEIDFNLHAFDMLSLTPSIKDILVALVRSGCKSAAKFDDLIKGKGKGIIFLLHGPAGVGKTFTAESLAEYTQRPLYTINCSDLSYYGQKLETQLSSALAMATKWNAIVLIDEADVFMAERNLYNLAQNELVSVLLRVIEYFEGVLFLTTNRVNTIDPAFKSRVHLSIAYPKLGEESRRGLWKIFLEKGSDQQHPAWLEESLLDEIARIDMNGREIKNAVRVAHALAEDKGRSLIPEDILLVLKSRTSFPQELSAVEA